MKFKETSDAKKGGLFVGKSHDEGGIPAIVTDTGTPIEVEGGEAIINKEATALHWKELSKINQSAGNGVPIPPPHGVSEKITDKLENGGKLTHKDRKDIYKKWKGLVNMTASELEKYYDSEDGKTSGLTESEAKKQGIDSGRESARWIVKMKRTKLAEWTPEMWIWANKQISFISRMKGVQGELFDNKGRRTRKHKALLIWGHNPKKYKGSGIFDGGGMTDKEFFETEKKSWQQEKDDFKEGGKTIAQTPAPKKDRIYGSEKNKPESSSSVKSASKIEFDDKTLAIIENKVEEHNEEHPDKKITLSSAKAVVRRGMGAYSSSHRPTISGGKPNSRTAWGIARLNAFIYKIVHGKSKSGKYSQDDDLINELGYSVSKYEIGGNPDIRFANGGNAEEGETFYTRTWNDGRVEKFSVDEYEKNIYPKLEAGGLTQYAKMDRIKSLLYSAFPEIISLDLLGKGLTGYAFLGTIGNDVLVVKYFQSVTEYWLTQMAMVSNPPNVVKFKDVKQLSDNFEYALIHEYVDTDALPNKYVWNYTLGFFPKENFPYLKEIPEKEKIYVSNMAKTKARAVEDYFGVTIDTNHSNWGYNENRELVLFDLDGNINKQQFLDWMESHQQKLETGGEIYDYHSEEYAEDGITESKEIMFDNGRLQIRNVGGSNVYYKKVNNQWDFLNETELKKLKEGAKHELEHSKTIKSAIQPEYNVNDIASAIAWDHLTEDMEYYDKLSKIEAPTKYATGGNIELKNEKMKIVTKWNEVPSNWRNVKGIKPLNFSFSPYDTKLQSIVKDFVSKDNLRPSLSGMFFDESGLTVTDAHKVLHLHFDNKEYSGIYPTVFTQKQIGYKGMNQEELAKQIALEKFPAYKNVIPKTFAFVNEFNVLKLRQYASSATNYANAITHACIFKVKEESFAVNIDFLESTLEAFLKIKQVDKLYFHYNSPNNGFVISDIKNFDIDKDTYCLVMPVMIERMDISYGTFNDITDISYNVYFDFTDGEIHNADGSVAKIEITYEDNSMLPLPLITLLDKFIKNSKSKDRVNVLYNFYVDENFIMVSDLESSIRIKNDFNMQSGLYEIKNNAVQFNLSESADDFPSQNTFEKSEEDAMMSSRSFIFYIEKAKECVGNDELRPIMTGLLLDFQANGTYLVSTDAHVLCKLNISDSIKIYNKDIIGKQFILGSIKQLDNFLSFIDCDSIQLSFEKNVDKNYSDNNEYRLTCGNKVFTAKLVDGKYPNYSAVIPFITDKMISLNVKDIYECVNTQTAKSFIKNNEIKPNEIYFYNVNNELYLSSASGNRYENNESTKICDIPFDFKEASSTIDEKSSLILIMPIESNATHIAFKTYQFNKIMAMISKDNTTILYKNLTSPYVVTSKNLYYNEETFNTVIPKSKKETKPKAKTSVEKPKAEKTPVNKMGRQPFFKVGDMVFVNYGEEAGKKGKITKVFSYEKYPESMKPDEVPYYEISNVGKEIPESNLVPFSESKNFPNAKVQSLFIDYLNSFYGKDDSIYGKNFPNKGFTRSEIKKAVDTYLMRKDLIWGNADSVDRENVRDILLATLPETKPTEKKKSVSKQDYQDAIEGVELLLSTGSLNKDKKQELKDYLEGLKVMLMSMK